MNKTRIKLISGFVALLLPGCVTRSFNQGQTESFNWEIVNSRWDLAAEREFSKWVEHLGEARERGDCTRFDQCLHSASANSLHTPSDDFLDSSADCRNLPLMLRAYFSYKTKRPFQYVSKVSEGRFARDNQPVAYRDTSAFRDLRKLFSTLAADASPENYRMAPQVEGTDTYPISISRGSLRPGTLFFDPNGTAYIVYKVEKNGAVRMLQGHENNNLSAKLFGERFVVGPAEFGGGFRNFRRYVQDASGQMSRGRNAEQPFFHAKEQYQTEFRLGETSRLTLHEWVRYQLSSEDVQPDPQKEFAERLQEICVQLQERAMLIDAATAAGLPARPHPKQMSENVLQADGDWEKYGTAGKDAEIRASFHELRTLIQKSVESQDQETQTQLLNAFAASWKKTNKECSLSFVDSQQKKQTITLNDSMERIYSLSFDPFHCPEMRWGIPPPRAGTLQKMLHTCPRNSEKETSYWQQQRQRQALSRTYLTPEGLTGPTTPENIHIPNLLQQLRE